MKGAPGLCQSFCCSPYAEITDKIEGMVTGIFDDGDGGELKGHGPTTRSRTGWYQRRGNAPKLQGAKGDDDEAGGTN